MCYAVDMEQMNEWMCVFFLYLGLCRVSQASGGAKERCVFTPKHTQTLSQQCFLLIHKLGALSVPDIFSDFFFFFGTLNRDLVIKGAVCKFCFPKHYKDTVGPNYFLCDMLRTSLVRELPFYLKAKWIRFH